MKNSSFPFRKLKTVFYLCTLSLLIPLGKASYAQQPATASKKTIVIDAGHGGHDAGALHFQLSKDEKDIALDIALKVGKLLQDSLKWANVIYTRQTDVFIPLQERHEIANRANADLFVSIHVNATAGTKTTVQTGTRYVGKGKRRRAVPTYRTSVNRLTSAQGTETYVLGLHRNPQKSRAIEDYGDNFVEEAGMLNPDDPTTQILVAQYTQAFLSKSIELASLVQDNFVKQGRNSYGVKQKGLEVLAGSTMPGVLVETGFINNPTDEQYLNSPEGQNQIASAIFHAIKSYFQTQKTKATATSN